jgi:hypothetical protein
MITRQQVFPILSVVVATAVIAACGGGGGSTTPPPPTMPPGPSPSPMLPGTMQVATGGTVGTGFTYSPAGNAKVVFSCGCSVQAGTSAADVNGAYSLVANSTPTPSAPDPKYTIVPGRNYIVIAKTAGGAEAWTTQFAGRTSATNKYLNAGNISDVAAAAVSLYVFNNSPQGSVAFDDWNFNALLKWYGTLTTPGAPNAAETQLLNDIAAQSAANNTLFPGAPSWDGSIVPNKTISKDLANVATSVDNTIPTPCPGNMCTGTPTP